MLYTERAELILQQLQLQAVVKISDLAELMQVSVDTVRRDLKAMEQNGLVKCVRGGACLPESLVSLSSFSGREIINSDRKREAARKALKYVRPGSVIALNSEPPYHSGTGAGSEKRPVYGDYQQPCGRFHSDANPSITLIAVGGNVDSVEKSTYGSECEQEFGKYYPDTAFLSINAVNYQDGFTDFRSWRWE